jgi:hypothetical protein
MTGGVGHQVFAGPIPLLAPVTIATLPVSP